MLLQVVVEEVPRSRCANLIILIFFNGENPSQFFEFFFSIAEKQIHQVVKFHHKKHCHYLSIYLFIYFKSFCLEWGLAMNI